MNRSFYYPPSETAGAIKFMPIAWESVTAKGKDIEAYEKSKLFNFDGVAYEGSYIETNIRQPVTLNRIVSAAFEYIKENAPDGLVLQAKPYIYALNERTDAYELMNLNLPSLSVSLPEDGTLLIEWNFEHFSIGLSFEPNLEDSGWYIVNDGTVKKMTAWGYLNSRTIGELIGILMSQVLEG